MVMMLKIRPDGDSDGGGERDGNVFPSRVCVLSPPRLLLPHLCQRHKLTFQ